MSSHLHLIISSEKENLSAIMRDFKKFTSKKIIEELVNGNDSRKEWMLDLFSKAAEQIKRNKHYKVWQDGNHCFRTHYKFARVKGGIFNSA